jgi:hypothetical protein
MDAYIKAFSDHACTVEIYSDAYEDVDFVDVSFDSNDGDDWWYPYLDELEQKLGDKWQKAIFYSEDLSEYRRFDRSVHYLRSTDVVTQSVVPRLLLFGYEDLNRALPTFSSNMLFDESNKKIDDVNRFKIGFDDMPIYMVRMFAHFRQEKFSKIFVVLVPEDAHMAFATLGQQYDRAIYLRDCEDWEKMEDLFFEFQKLKRLKKTIEYMIHQFEYRDAVSVRTLKNSVRNIQRKLDGFFDYFCKQFPLR